MVHRTQCKLTVASFKSLDYEFNLLLAGFASNQFDDHMVAISRQSAATPNDSRWRANARMFFDSHGHTNHTIRKRVLTHLYLLQLGAEFWNLFSNLKSSCFENKQKARQPWYFMMMMMMMMMMKTKWWWWWWKLNDDDDDDKWCDDDEMEIRWWMENTMMVMEHPALQKHLVKSISRHWFRQWFRALRWITWITSYCQRPSRWSPRWARLCSR